VTSSQRKHYQRGQPITRPRFLRAERVPGIAELWRETLGDPAITIAVLDGPVDLSHPALRRANIVQHDALGRSGSTGTLAREHATHIASLIFGAHDSGVRGIAPLCRGLVIPIYRDDGNRVSCSQKDLAKGINEAVRLGAKIINISGGQLTRAGAASNDLRLAIRNCIDSGRVIVAAVGNDGCRECLHVPGAIPSVLAVGAMDANGEPLPSSNWGEIYRAQGILAPGHDVLGAVPGGSVAPRTGSSFAAGVVSGIAGLLLSIQKKRGERPDPYVVREALVRTARNCTHQVSAACDRLLAGRLNVHGAVHFLKQGVSHMTSKTASSIGPGGQDARAPRRATPKVTPSGSSPKAGMSQEEDPELDEETGEEEEEEAEEEEEQDAQEDEVEDVEEAAVRRSARPQRPRGPSVRTSSVKPSCGCGCAGKGQKVYAIGDLDVDFVSPARRDSIQANAPDLPLPGLDPNIESRFAFLRYLLGIDIPEMPEGAADIEVSEEIQAAVAEAKRATVNGNLYDAESVIWVLKQGDCPMYAIKPAGAFAEAAYRQLVIFLIEQTFENFQDFANAAVSDHCLNEFYGCYGGIQEPFRDTLLRPETISLVEEAETASESRRPRRRRRGRGRGGAEEEASAQGEPGTWTPTELVRSSFALFNEPLLSAAHVAIAGEIAGTCRLFTGEEVEVIAPVMRGMQNWNTRRLVEKMVQTRALNLTGFEPQVTMLALKVVSRLYELVRNAGKDPCDRAKNYMATKELFNLAITMSNPMFLSMLGAVGPTANDQRQVSLDVRQLLNIALDDLQCKPAQCVRYGTDPYEVELSFYNFANQFMGTAVISQTIDVNDVVPVAIDKTRVFPRRT
jgi:hypothetical protein